MKFFSAFPNFSGRNHHRSSQNTSIDAIINQSESATFDDSITKNGEFSENGKVKRNLSAASAAYLKFVKSHDVRVGAIKKHN